MNVLNSSVDVENVNCKHLNIGAEKDEALFQIIITNDEKILFKIRGKEEFEIDIEKIYNYLKESFKK